MITASWDNVVLLGGKRTPFADYTGELADVSPIDLGIKAGKAAIAEVVRKFEISVDELSPENLEISATEFMNVTRSKLMLHFKSV